MRKSHSLLRSAFCAAAILATPMSASAAGTFSVDRTIEQQCSYAPEYTSEAPKKLSMPIRLELTVPQSLKRGEPLVIDQRRVSLSSLGALYDAVDAPGSERDYRVTFSGGGQYRGALVSITGGSSPIHVAPDLSANWNLGSDGPASIVGPKDGGLAPALSGIDVPSGDVAITYTGYTASIALGRYDYFYSYKLTCEPAAPVVLATVPVSTEPGPPVVDALSDLQSPLAGGDTIRIQGHNLTGADAVTFGGTPATSFAVKNDGVIEAKVPAHTAVTDAQVQVSRGGNASIDTDADDFDFVAPAAPGNFDVLLNLTCTDSYVTPRTHSVGLRLRGKVPANVQPGATFSLTDLHAGLLFDAKSMTFGRPESRWAYGYLSELGVAIQGATTATGRLGDGWLKSPLRRVQFGEPAAFEGAFDQPRGTPQPPNTITASAPAGGEVVVSFAEAEPIAFGEYGGGEYAGGPQMQSCVVTAGSGDGVIARIPVGAAPVDQKPVVTKVSGVVFAGVGGVVAVTGQRLNGGSVRIGGRSAARLFTVGSTTYVSAPALPAGTYDVVVTTAKGSSAVTAASKLRYPRVI